MGNIAHTGHAFNMCGITDAVGFEGSAKALINLHNIEPWDARGLIKDNLQKQSELARRSPMRKVPVKDGLDFMRAKAGNNMGLGSNMFGSGADLSKERFVDTIVMLLGAKEIPHTPAEREDLNAVFDSMDFDGNGSLSTGEWAAGLSVFFKGSMEEAVQAVFSCLDINKDGGISKKELQVYLGPFVKAMSPPSAAAIRPLLEKKAVDDIYYDMDMDHTADISSSEMIAWTKKGNNIVDKLADIIDKEVYQIWLAENKKNPKPRQNTNGQNAQDPYANQNSQFNSGGPQGNGYGPQGNGYGPQPGNGYGPPGGGNGYGPPGSGYGPPGNGYGPPGAQTGNGYGPGPNYGPGGSGNEYGPGPAQGASNDQSWFGGFFGSGGGGNPPPGNSGGCGGASPGGYGGGGNQGGCGGGSQGRYAPAPPAHAPDPFANQSWDVPPPPSHPSQAGGSWGPPSSGGGGGGIPPPPAYGGSSYGGYGGGGGYGAPSSSPPYQSSAPYAGGGYR
mmetsp:Transcript_19785/g.35181  ORF Transcript_19785/g.35181 Transcript_19785/m.35181 type:complete len:502 (-) Transcript_19785:151-1656(-)